jgi:hypothetical protein
MKCARLTGKGAQLLNVIVSSLLLFSCVGGSNTTPTGTPISITLLPSANTVSLGQSVVISANVYDQSNQGATWTLNPVNFGTLTDVSSSSVTYTAPTDFTVPTKITVTATSVSNPSVIASVQISVSPIVVALTPFAPQTINAGEQLGIFPNVQNDTMNSGVTWTISPASGAGTLIDASSSGVTYVAPASVSDPIRATITASSIANPSATSSVEITALASGAGPNVAAVSVDGGPVVGSGRRNAAFTSLTICNPGSTIVCQTVDGILVDTGSYGLRILQSQIPLLKLPTLTDGSGNALQNCVSNPDGTFLWGPVAQADVNIGAQTAPAALIQIITNSINQPPDLCSQRNLVNLNTPELLGANGILGIGPEPTDCTVSGKNLCDGSVQPFPPNVYFSCPAHGCLNSDQAVLVSREKQVTNPVTLFGIDNNGTLLQITPVSAPQVKAFGTLTFGIDTETNNALGAATVYTANAAGDFTTIFNQQLLTSSFIDSGVGENLFPGLMPTCAVNTSFYCPPGLRNLVATNKGFTQGIGDVPFDVDNADTMFASYPGFSALSELAAHNGAFNTCVNGEGACSFVWGLPFFYGRAVYTQIDGQRPPFGSPGGPWWAY